MLNRAQNDELNLLAVKAAQGDIMSRELLAERLYPVSMVIAKRFFQEYHTGHLTRRELAQECCLAFFSTGLRNYKLESGDVMSYFAGLCVWVGCKARAASKTARRGGSCRMIRVDAMTGPDDEDAWESIGLKVLDKGQQQVDASDSVRAAQAGSSATETQWRVMRLVYENGMSYREAGEFLGLTYRQVAAMLKNLQMNSPYLPKEKENGDGR